VKREEKSDRARCAVSSDVAHRAVMPSWGWVGVIAIFVAAGGVAVALTRGPSNSAASGVQPPPAQAFADAADQYPPAVTAAAPNPPVTAAPTTRRAAPSVTIRTRQAPSPATAAAHAPRLFPARTVGVGASTPVWIEIRSIGVSAPIDPLWVNADGSLAVPQDFNRAGYYSGRPTPGEIGPAIVVAHIDSKTGPAVFAHLSDLKPGAEVMVTRADGSRIAFVVDRLERHPKNAFPTEEVYGPTPDAALRLISCGGSFDHASGHYRDNYIAFAHLRGPA